MYSTVISARSNPSHHAAVESLPAFCKLVEIFSSRVVVSNLFQAKITFSDIRIKKLKHKEMFMSLFWKYDFKCE